jgi:hypothetical protein
MHADKARTTYCGIPSVDTLWDDYHVELLRRKRSNQGSISRTGARLCAIPTVYTTRTMVSALLPDLMRMQLLSRFLSDLFRSRNKTVVWRSQGSIWLVLIKKQNRHLFRSKNKTITCFDQETKSSLVSIKKQNRHLFRSRNKTVVPMAKGHCFLFFIYCPALPLPLPCPVSNFPFAARDRRRKLYKERAVFFFLLLPGTRGGSYTGNGQCFFLLLLGTGGGSYTRNFFSFCCQGQEEEVT